MMPRRAAHCAQTEMRPDAKTASRRTDKLGEWSSWLSGVDVNACKTASPVSHKLTSLPDAAAVAATVKAWNSDSWRSRPQVHLTTRVATLWSGLSRASCGALGE